MALFGTTIKGPYHRNKVPKLKENGYDFPAIYVLYYIRDGPRGAEKIKYIGEGYCLWERLKHWDDKLGPHEWNYFKYQKGPYKKSKRKNKEKELIKKHKPPLNVQHNK